MSGKLRISVRSMIPRRSKMSGMSWISNRILKSFKVSYVWNVKEGCSVIKPDSFKLILSFAVKSRFRFDVYCKYFERNTDK